MGSSTTTLQSVVDYVSSLGELMPVLPTGGFSVNTALTMATDVMLDLISQRFNHKWNRMKIPPWYTNSWQQDYAQLGSSFPAPIGWLEKAYWIDINSTSLPKPLWEIECVRDLETTVIPGNPPAQISWLPNNQLVQGVWPGAGEVYTQPLGAVITPTNPPTNILDANGNILILTVYGTTGATAPVLPANSAEGLTVVDGGCTWTVAGPNSQGFRIKPLPPQQGIVYQVNMVAQMRAPVPFQSMATLLNPIPDDYANWFRQGFIARCYQMSPNPQMQAMFEKKKENWLAAMESAMKQGDRETDNAGFVPDRSIVAPQGGVDYGPAMPYPPGYFGLGG